MRTRQEIDTEYTNIAMQYGDALFKVSHLQEQIKAMHLKMQQLNQEPAAPSGHPLMAIPAEALPSAVVEATPDKIPTDINTPTKGKEKNSKNTKVV